MEPGHAAPAQRVDWEPVATCGGKRHGFPPGVLFCVLHEVRDRGERQFDILEGSDGGELGGGEPTALESERGSGREGTPTHMGQRTPTGKLSSAIAPKRAK
jgi:hypothetical protein